MFRVFVCEAWVMDMKKLGAGTPTLALPTRGRE
jgi:hypothetical protein